MIANLASYALLSAALAAPSVVLLLAWRRTPLSLVQFLLWLAAQPLTRLLWRGTTSGPLPLVPGQGAVLVCNHRSSVDPFFIQTLTTRKTHWLVAREFCEHPAFRWFLRTCEVIPVNRGGIDTSATRQAIRLASNGEIVGMLPEGRINMTEQFMLAGRPGAVLVALKARVPILPCYIEGAPYDQVPYSPFLMPAKVQIHFGQPFDLSDYYDREGEEGTLQEVLRRTMKAIADLAGQPDFEPQLAGRRWKPTADELASDMAGSRQRRRERGQKAE